MRKKHKQVETKKHATKKNPSVSIRKSKRTSENTLRKMKIKTICLWDVAKTVLKEKFIETHAYLKKQRKRTEPNVSRKKEIIKIRRK